MIPVFVLAIGLVWTVRAKSVGVSVRRLLGQTPRADTSDWSVQPERDAYALMVRAAGILLSVGGLVAVWITIHAAMGKSVLP